LAKHHENQCTRFFAFFEIIFFGVFFGEVWRNLGKNPSHSVAVLRGGERVGHDPPRFLAGLLLGPPVFCLISHKISPMLGLIGLITANQSSSQRKITMQQRCLCWPHYYFPWPRSVPASFSILESPLFPPPKIRSRTVRRREVSTMVVANVLWEKIVCF